MANNNTCNSAYLKNGTHIIYNWIINSKKALKPHSHVKILRKSSDVEISFSCAILLGKSKKIIKHYSEKCLESKVSTGEVKVLFDSTQVVLPAAQTSFLAEMGIYSDSTFSKLKDASIPITIPG